MNEGLACSTCRWWAQHEFNLPRRDKRHRKGDLEGYGQCAVLSCEVEGTYPVVQDVSDYLNPVYTLPSFYCNQFVSNEINRRQAQPDA